jgi:hypothetical protein
VNFYRFRQGGASAGLQLRDGLQAVLSVVTYQVEGDGPPVAEARVTLDGDDLVVADVSRGRDRSVVRARIPLWSILAASAATGRITIHRAGGPPIAIRDRRGLFASRPRPDHYRALERWLALLDAEAAERRWRAIGVEAHAAELGIPMDDAADVHDAAERTLAGTPAGNAAGDSASPAGAPGASVADSLRALDALRADQLVSDTEYDAKRREILARL